MASAKQKVRDGVEQQLRPGERLLTCFSCVPHGTTMTRAAGAAGGGLVGVAVGEALNRRGGGRQQREAHAGAERAGIALAPNMAVGLTDERLLILAMSTPQGFGIGGAVGDPIADVPRAEVTGARSKRFGIRVTLTLEVRGHELRVETNAGGPVKELVAALA